MYTHHTYCRACSYAKPGAQGTKSNPTDKLIEVMDLGVQPLANDFQDDFTEHSGSAPLKVLFCPRCTLAQLSVVVRPDILYRNYSYVTSTTDMMKEHFVKLWGDMNLERKVHGVVEIGSNTGEFLAFCLDWGAHRVVGIDPAENLCRIAFDRNSIATIPEPLTQRSAYEVNKRVKSDAVVARHVFCHVDDWKGFISNLASIGHAETVYYIEVPYCVDMMAKNSWDQIYHEHLSYLTIRSMDALLKNSGMHIHSVKRYTIHGGAIVITLRRDESKVPSDVYQWAEIGGEDVTADKWTDFSHRAELQQMALVSTIESLLAKGKTVVGFGASAKSTVWINACGLTRKHLRFICDSTPQKQWKFSPGTDIPIVDEGAMLRELPDYAVCFAWNFLEEVLWRQAAWRNQGGKFIVPVPEVHVV